LKACQTAIEIDPENQVYQQRLRQFQKSLP